MMDESFYTHTHTHKKKKNNNATKENTQMTEKKKKLRGLSTLKKKNKVYGLK